jgi:hypothetical protein
MRVAREIAGPVGKERHGEDGHSEDEYVDLDFVVAADVGKIEAPCYSNIIDGMRESILAGNANVQPFSISSTCI